MPREVDERKKRKALRKLRKAAELAARGVGPPLSDWEKEFLEEVGQRIEEFGSAFADPDKGNLEEPMSALQTLKLREIDKKARGKGGGFKQRKPLGAKKKPAYTPRVRQVDEDLEAPADEQAPPRPKGPPSLGVIRGSDLPASGKSEKPVKRAKPKLRLIQSPPAED